MGLISHFTLRRRLSLSGLALCLLLLLSPTGASAAGSRRIGSRPSIPSGATATGELPQSTQLSVTVTLQPRDPAALAAYATEVSTPGSSVYHQYLSVSEFAQRFGPTAAQVDQAEAAMRAEGLTPGRLAPDGLSFDVTASAARLASGFHTSFERYRLASGRTAYANTSAPLLTGSGASVIQSVVGLNNLAVEKPQGLVRATAKATSSGASQPRVTSSSAVTACSAAASDSSRYDSYTAPQIAGAYGFGGLYSSGDEGSGETVALFELEPYSPSDISAYQACYGTSATVANETVDGGAGSGYGAGEAALDIEDVIGLVPEGSVRVYEGPNTAKGALDTYAKIVSDDTAKVVSTSWGECESAVGSTDIQAENTLFEEAAAQGQSVFSAAGDNGTQDCTNSRGRPTGGSAVDDPASQPYVTGVGGTSLSISPFSESVWNDGYQPNGGGGAGGGGVSTVWPEPSYQSGFARSQSSISCGSGGYSCREVPDVSADADEDTGYDIYWDGGWTDFGGTSVAAPTWASLFALADASATCTAPIGFANPSLYAAARTAYAADFNDVTSGNNSFDGVTGYYAKTGYDMASGLGSPKGAALAGTMCGAQGDSVSLSGVPASASGRVGSAWRTATIKATDTLGAAITYTASGLPAGIGINHSTGVISGTPTKAADTTVTIKATDAYGVSASRSFKFVVAGRPRIGSRQLHISGTKGSLSLTLRAGQYAANLQKVELIAPRGAHLAGGRTARRSVNAFTLAGKRQAITRKLSHGKLLVTLKTALSGVRLRLTGSELTFSKTLATRLSQRTKTVTLRLLVTDAAGTQTPLKLTLH